MKDFTYNIDDVINFLGGGLDKSIVMSLIEVFIQSVNDEFPKFQEAIEQNNLERIHKIGHKLKGSSANLGFEKFRSLCEILEKSAKQHTDCDYASVFNDLKNEKILIEDWYNSNK